jgi:DNA-binding NtrC family response regulator
MKIEKSGEVLDSAKESLECPTCPPARILMVADDPCGLNAEVLRRHGYQVGSACGSKAGWEMLQTNPYHLLITENDLTWLTGVGLLKKLRSACMSLPVIITLEPLPAWQSAEFPWLLKTAKLFKPYTIMESLGLLRRVFPATSRVRAEMAMSSNWQDLSLIVCGLDLS